MTEYELPPHGHNLTAAQLRTIAEAVSEAEARADDAAVHNITLSALEPRLRLTEQPVAAEFSVWRESRLGGEAWAETLVVDGDGAVLMYRTSRDDDQALG